MAIQPAELEESSASGYSPPMLVAPVSVSLKRTAANLSSVIGGELLLRAANFAVVVVIARLYCASALGVYATALAFATVAVMLADNGLQISAIAEVGQNPNQVSEVVSRLYAAKTLLLLPMFGVLVLIG
jgi:O-antigen/teichoic acid export membrane protein